MTVSGIRYNRFNAHEADPGGQPTYTSSRTIIVPGRNILADVVLVGAWFSGESHRFGKNSAYAGVSQIVSLGGGTEEFDVRSSRMPTIYRRDVTSVTFSLFVNEASAVARWMIYYWD